MKRLFITEAVELHNSRLKKGETPLTYTSLARNLWPDSDTKVATVNMNGLKNGSRSSVPISFVPIICDICGVDANFLFGIKKK